MAQGRFSTGISALSWIPLLLPLSSPTSIRTFSRYFILHLVPPNPLLQVASDALDSLPDADFYLLEEMKPILAKVPPVVAASVLTSRYIVAGAGNEELGAPAEAEVCLPVPADGAEGSRGRRQGPHHEARGGRPHVQPKDWQRKEIHTGARKDTSTIYNCILQ